MSKMRGVERRGLLSLNADETWYLEKKADQRDTEYEEREATTTAVGESENVQMVVDVDSRQD